MIFLTNFLKLYPLPPITLFLPLPCCTNSLRGTVRLTNISVYFLSSPLEFKSHERGDFHLPFFFIIKVKNEMPEVTRQVEPVNRGVWKGHDELVSY